VETTTVTYEYDKENRLTKESKTTKAVTKAVTLMRREKIQLL